MTVYRCRVLGQEGRQSELLREAVSEEILVRELNREGLFPLEVRPAGREPSGRRGAGRFSTEALVEFTATMGLLLSSGLTFKDCLEVARTIFLKGPVQRMVARLSAEIDKGRAVHEALDPEVSGFPPIFHGFIRIGERIGSLEGSFRQLSEYLGERRKLRSKLTGSLLYPAMVLGVALAGISGLVLFVFPRIREMFSQLGSALPARLEAMTGLLTGLLAGLAAAVAAGVVAAVALSAARRRRPALAERLDRLALKLPLVGRLSRLQQMLNLTFAMETMTAGGLAVEDALQEAEGVVQNRALRAGIRGARERLLKGESLSRAFLADPVFPERLGRWMAVGERSGQVAPVFAQLRRYHQEEIEKWSTRFMSLVEPVLIVLVGIILLVLILLFITPIFSMYEGMV